MTPDIIPILKSLTKQGFTVAYVDSDSTRRQLASKIKGVTTSEPKLTAQSSPHVNVLVTVNEHEFDHIVLKELNNIPGYIQGVYPTTIRITI